MANGGKQSMDVSVFPVPIDFTGEELMGLFTITAATVAGGPQAGFVSSKVPPAVQLRRFMTATARARLPLGFKSILQIMFRMLNEPVDPLWAEISYPVAGTTHHETPAQQLFCVLCYFGRLLLEPKTGLPSMVPYYKLLRCTSQVFYKPILLESELLEPIRAMLSE